MARWKRLMTSTPFSAAITRQLLLLALACEVLADFSSEPRWGQAAAVINNILYVSGGKTDEYGSYSYTSAPTTNDLFTLDLSQSVDLSSPSWTYISGSQSSSTPQGQKLAWHTLAAYNTSQLLLFGGDGGPNSPIVLPSQSNSAQILDVSSSTPEWVSETEGWASEPPRRIHQTTATNGGKVFMVGGEKDDGSTEGYSDHYVFDPAGPTFTQLPSSDGPSNIYGHCAVMLSDGRMFILGGYTASQAALNPFDSVWTMDTTSSSLAWSTESIDSSSVPSGRRAFACTRINDDKILIHGGSDASFETSYSDGWILDTSKSPMEWSQVDALSDLGARRDHTAVQVGDQVLFVFGYASNAGASTSISIFDTGSQSFTSSFTPQSSPSYTTLPASTGTDGPSSNGDGDGSTGSGARPTGGVNPSGTGTGPQSTSDSGDGGSDNSNHAAIITAASILSVFLVAVVIGLIVIVIVRRKRTQNRFRMLHEEGEDPETPTSAGVAAGVFMLVPWLKGKKMSVRGEKTRMLDKQEGWTVLGLGRPQGPNRRVDMLANEDASFAARRQGSGSTRSWFSVNDSSPHQRYASRNSSRPSIGRLFSDPLGSLKDAGAGVRRVFSGGSARSHGREGTDISLPFDADDYEDSEGLLLHDKEGQLAPDPPANEDEGRLRGGKGGHLEVMGYSDPFLDPLSEVIFDSTYNDYEPSFGSVSRTTSRLAANSHAGGSAENPSPFSTLSSSSQIPQLHPLVTTASKASTDDPSSSSVLNASSTGHVSSSSSNPSVPRSPSGRPRTISLVGSVGIPSSPVKRSDSWWQRFKRTSSIRDTLREQNRYAPAAVAPIDFRDPNPPPGRLGAIKEGSGGSAGTNISPTSVTNVELNHRKTPSGVGRVYSTAGHEQSTTSFKTNKTADSAVLERLAGRYDIAQREATSGSTEYNTASVTKAQSHIREGTWSSVARSLEESRAPSPALVEETQDIAEADSSILKDDVVQSPVDVLSGPLSPTRREKDLLNHPPVRRTPSTPRKRGSVAARIAELESRMSVELESASSPPIRAKSPPLAGKRKSENVKYGFVPRPELFVANPDQRSIGSSGS